MRKLTEKPKIPQYCVVQYINNLWDNHLKLIFDQTVLLDVDVCVYICMYIVSPSGSFCKELRKCWR